MDEAMDLNEWITLYVYPSVPRYDYMCVIIYIANYTTAYSSVSQHVKK
jgi:hypothetical protein